MSDPQSPCWYKITLRSVWVAGDDFTRSSETDQASPPSDYLKCSFSDYDLLLMTIITQIRFFHCVNGLIDNKLGIWKLKYRWGEGLWLGIILVTSFFLLVASECNDWGRKRIKSTYRMSHMWSGDFQLKYHGNSMGKE